MAKFERVMCPMVGCYHSVALKFGDARERRDANYIIANHRRTRHREAKSLLDSERQEKWAYEHKPGEG